MEVISIKRERKIDRLDKYMNYKGLNDNRITTDLALSVGTLGKSRNPNRDLSNKTIELILNFYVDLNRIWLLTGEGEMLKQSTTLQTEPAGDFNTTMLLPISAQAGSLNDFVMSIEPGDCERVISPIKNVDFAIPVAGDSMQPEYPNGSQILVKRINTQAFIEWGKVYVLDTCNGTIVKEVRKDDDKEFIVCYSRNPDPKYQPFRVAFADIYGMYRVLMCMSLK